MADLVSTLATFLEGLGGIVGIRAGTPEPAYTVLARLPDRVEIRRYGPETAVEARLPADAPRGANTAFSALFGYIQQGNAARRRIAMTVPVSQSRAAAPDGGPELYRMRFFLPPDVAKSGAPAPLDPKLALVDLPARDVATIRFSGVPGPAIRRDRQAVLTRAIDGAGWHPVGAPVLLTYDPPFALPFVRRNEVAVDVARAGAPARTTSQTP